MNWIYRLQTRLAITPAESTALLTLAVLFGLGLGVQHLQARLPPPDESAYAHADSVFAAAEAPSDRLGPPVSEGPVDLNTADAAALERLPRIGPRTAERILAHRAAHGPFRRVDDLADVAGIGPKTLAGLRDLVAVGPPADPAQASTSSSSGGGGGATRRASSSSVQ